MYDSSLYMVPFYFSKEVKPIWQKSHWRHDEVSQRQQNLPHPPKAHTGAVPQGNLTRLDNALSKIPSHIEAANAQLENLHNQQVAAKEELGKPFPQEQELQQKSARLAELDAELSMDGPSEPETPAPKERPSVLKELRERMAQLADSRSGDDMEVAL